MEFYDIDDFIQSNEVDLSSMDINKIRSKLQSINNLFGLSHIENVDLSNSSLGLNNISFIKRLLTGDELFENSNFKISNLKSINISKNKITNKIIENIIDCTFNINLKSINISKNHFDIFDIVHLLELTINNHFIDFLDISYCSILNLNNINYYASPNKKPLSKRSLLNPLKSINNSDVNSSKFEMDIDLTINNNVSCESKDDFELNKCSFKFNDLIVNNSLKKENYFDNNDCLNKIIENPNLLNKKQKHINTLSVESINNETFRLASAKKILSYNSPDPNRTINSEFKSNNKTNSRLQNLNLSGNCLGEYNLNKLFNIIQNFIYLKSLDLSDNMMGDNCFKYISQYLNSSHSKNLEYLNLNNNSPSIKGINLLFRVLQKRKTYIKISMYKSLCTVSMITKFRILMKQNQKVNIIFEDTDLYFLTSDDDNESSDKNIDNKSQCFLKRKNSVYSFSKENINMSDNIDDIQENENNSSMDQIIIKKHKTNKIPYTVYNNNFSVSNKVIIDQIKLNEQFDQLTLKEK